MKVNDKTSTKAHNIKKKRSAQVNRFNHTTLSTEVHTSKFSTTTKNSQDDNQDDENDENDNYYNNCYADLQLAVTVLYHVGESGCGNVQHQHV